MQFKKMNINDIQQNTDKLLQFISDKFTNNDIDNDSLVKIIELCGSYLNLMTISDYAKSNKMSYNGVKKFRHVKEIFNTKYVIDND